MPRFTIGIPTYNRANFLRQALVAALDQTATDVEVLVSDNASTDETAEVVRSFGDRVRYHRNPTNVGAWANCKKLVELADSEYFSWLQDDDLIHRDFARRASEALASDPEIHVYAAYSIHSPSTTTHYYPWIMGPAIALDWMRGGLRVLDGRVVPPLSLFHSFAIPPALAFRTSALRDVLATLGRDCDLFQERIVLAAAANRGKIAVDPWPGAIFLAHEAQEHRVIQRDDASAFANQWLVLAEALGHLVEGDGERWKNELPTLFRDVAVEHRVRWLNVDTPGPEVWRSAPGFAAEVREMLLDSLPIEARGLVRGETPREGRTKAIVRDLVPPVILRAFRACRRAKSKT